MADTQSLERLDIFPYRHRVAQVMEPLITIPPQASLREAAQHMVKSGVSALVVADEAGHAVGIVAEGDLVAALAQQGGKAAAQTVDSVMSAPVSTVRQDALVYVALGRMERLHLRHLAAVDEKGRATGLVTTAGMLHLRAAQTLAIGDEIVSAHSGEEMGAVRARLAGLAGALLADGVDAESVAEVTSSVLGDVVSRAARLAEESMIDDGWGAAPVRWAVLLLGAGGRREALLAPDQDNAIVYDGTPHHDVWFAEVGRRMVKLLDAAGLPQCRAGVMASSEKWRRPLSAWIAQIDRWAEAQVRQEAAGLDVFADLRAVHGDLSLGEELGQRMLDKIGPAPRPLQYLAEVALGQGGPLGMLGQFKTREGRLDLKLHGLLPLVSAVRVLALRHGVGVTGTAERLGRLEALGVLGDREAALLTRAHRIMVGALLEQQVADAAVGVRPGQRVDARLLPPERRGALKDALRSLSSLSGLISASMPGTSV